MYNINSYALNELMSLVRSEPVPPECLLPAELAVTYDDFLALLPPYVAASMQCKACRKWWNAYSNAVFIDKFGRVDSVFWLLVTNRTRSTPLRDLALYINEQLCQAFHKSPLMYRVANINTRLQGIRNILSRGVVGGAGNHFGHRILDKYWDHPSIDQQTRLEKYLSDQLTTLISNQDVLADLLTTLPIRMHTLAQTEAALHKLTKNLPKEGNARLYMALSDLPTGAAYVFGELGARFPEWSNERALAEGHAATDILGENCIKYVSGIVELLNRLRAGVSHATPQIQRQWGLERISDRTKLPGYVPIKPNTAPVLTETAIVNYQFTAEKIFELTRNGRLTQVRPIEQVTDIRLQVPVTTADGGSLTIQLPKGPTDINWFLLNSSTLLRERPYVEGWTLNPVDGGQGLVAAVVTATEAGVCQKPSCRLQNEELMAAIPDERRRTLFADAERIECPKLHFSAGDTVMYDLRNMPMEAVLDGLPIRFVQVRPADI